VTRRWWREDACIDISRCKSVRELNIRIEAEDLKEMLEKCSFFQNTLCFDLFPIVFASTNVAIYEAKRRFSALSLFFFFLVRNNQIDVDWVMLSMIILLIISRYIHVTYFSDEHLENVPKMSFRELCCVYIYIPPAQLRNFRSVYTGSLKETVYIFYGSGLHKNLKKFLYTCEMFNNKFLNKNWTTFYLFFYILKFE